MNAEKAGISLKLQKDMASDEVVADLGTVVVHFDPEAAADATADAAAVDPAIDSVGL